MNPETFEKPRALCPGDRIGLVAPSSPFSEEALRAGIRFLEAQGFRVHYLSDLFARRKGFLAGEDTQRSEEIQYMFEDPEIRAVFVVRGGYGALRIMDRLDPEIIKRNPKIFLGYSDATCLLSFLLERCGLVCFHGPLVVEMGSLSEATEQALLRILTATEPLGDLPLEGAKWIHEGQATGRLVGGNLSVLCSTLGTPWEVETEGRILLLEDRGEKPYRVDRMLVQLRQSKKLTHAAGVLFGDLLAGALEQDASWDKKAMEEVLYENTRDLGIPVIYGLPIGHGKTNIPLPLGALAELNGKENRFSIVESAVTP